MDVVSLILSLIIFVFQRDINGLPMLTLSMSKKSNSDIYLNCSSDTKPFGDAAEFLVDGMTYNNIRMLNQFCYKTKEGAKCLPDTCSCSKDGRSYSLTYKTRRESGIINFGCSMQFASENSSDLKHAHTELRTEVSDLGFSETTSTDLSTRIEYASETTTVVICNYTRPNNSSDMCEETGKQSGNLNMRILADMDGNKCLCYFRKEQTNGSHELVLFLSMCLGIPVILSVIAVCVQAVLFSRKRSRESAARNQIMYDNVIRDETDMHIYRTTQRPYEALFITDQPSSIYNTLNC